MLKTLNIGCGNRTFTEYPKEHTCINYDERSNLSNIDIIGDARKLPFQDVSFDYILASDIIEHFPIKETTNILTEWKRVLKNNGTIELRMPNLKQICKKYIEGLLDTKTTSWLLYGGQDYSGNFHYVGFDREFFKSIASAIGFIEIGYKEADNNFIIKFKKIN